MQKQNTIGIIFLMVFYVLQDIIFPQSFASIFIIAQISSVE